MNELQLRLFDYDVLDVATRTVVQQRTEEIKALVRRSAQDIQDIGQKLDEVRARLQNGQFNEWLRAEFNWSRSMAYNFIHVWERFGGVDLEQLYVSASALYLLAAPGTPETAREEALIRAEEGEAIGPSTAREIVDAHQPKRYCRGCGTEIGADATVPYCARCRAQQGKETWERVRRREQVVPGSAQEIAPPEPGVVVTTGRPEPQTLPPAQVRREEEPDEEDAEDLERRLDEEAEVEELRAGKVVTVEAPSPPPAPRPAPVMRPIESAAEERTVILVLRILPANGGARHERRVMGTIGEEGRMPATMKAGRYDGLAALVAELQDAYFGTEVAATAEVLAVE